jgi:predicted RNA binding protein YcfA (HicA-like mRNA interferase family)
MGKGKSRLEAMRRSASGWSQEDFMRVLEAHGFELVRHVRHGAFYRHPVLARHPDAAIRSQMAQVVIPKGNSLRDYVAEEVIKRIDLLAVTEPGGDDGEQDS